jgi:hypothetical protein
LLFFPKNPTNSYIPHMSLFTQSTYLPVRPDQAWTLLAQTPRTLTLSAGRPSLSYVARSGWDIGSVVEFSLNFGLYRITWMSTVVSRSLDGLSVETRLAEGSLLQNFHSWHVIVPHDNGASLREAFEYEARESAVQDLIAQSLVTHALASRALDAGITFAEIDRTRDMVAVPNQQRA